MRQTLTIRVLLNILVAVTILGNASSDIRTHMFLGLYQGDFFQVSTIFAATEFSRRS